MNGVEEMQEKARVREEMMTDEKEDVMKCNL